MKCLFLEHHNSKIDTIRWYIEKNNALTWWWSNRYVYYQVGDGLNNDAPYYISDNKEYAIWKIDNGNWCNGFMSQFGSTYCSLFSSSEDICSSDWYYLDENTQWWQPALDGVAIQCQSGIV